MQPLPPEVGVVKLAALGESADLTHRYSHTDLASTGTLGVGHQHDSLWGHFLQHSPKNTVAAGFCYDYHDLLVDQVAKL